MVKLDIWERLYVITCFENNVGSGIAHCKQHYKELVFDSHDIDVSEETLTKTAVAQQLLRQPKNNSHSLCV